MPATLDLSGDDDGYLDVKFEPASPDCAPIVVHMDIWLWNNMFLAGFVEPPENASAEDKQLAEELTLKNDQALLERHGGPHLSKKKMFALKEKIFDLTKGIAGKAEPAPSTTAAGG
jgi:hypothetical protein